MEARNPLPADLERRLDNLIRLGTIAEVDLNRALCRVKTGKNITSWLPWVAARAGETRTWCPPTVGEQVIVLSPSGDIAAGVVLTAVYADSHDQPSKSGDDHIRLWPDGAVERYDHVTNRYLLNVPEGGQITIQIGPSRIEMDRNGVRISAPRIDLN